MTRPFCFTSACASTVIAVALSIAPSLVSAQSTSRALTKPEVEFSEPFTSIAAVRELRDGRVLVADLKDKTLQVVDLKSKKAAKVGREGSGPGEYGLPMALIAMPGDSTIVFDPINSRYLTILPDGKPGVTFRLEDGAPAAAGSPGGRGGLQGVQAPRAVDAMGRLYFEGSPISFGPNGPVASDSVPVLRFERKTHKYDTLTYVQLAKGTASVTTTGSAGNQNVNVRMGGNTPFPARDGWAVLPNGSVAVVRIKDYRVDVVSPTKQLTKGAVVAYTPVKVGDAERQEFRDAQKNPVGVGLTRTVENGKVTTGTAPIRPAEEPKEWPAVKPAFTANGVLAAPNGDIWVPRSRAAKDLVPRYDIFSAAGRFSGQVTLPMRTRVIGFGAGGVIYTVRTDDDDLQYLQRFRG